MSGVCPEPSGSYVGGRWSISGCISEYSHVSKKYSQAQHCRGQRSSRCVEHTCVSDGKKSDGGIVCPLSLLGNMLENGRRKLGGIRLSKKGPKFSQREQCSASGKDESNLKDSKIQHRGAPTMRGFGCMKKVKSLSKDALHFPHMPAWAGCHVVRATCIQ